MRAFNLRVSARVVLACLLACGLQVVTSAQGRGHGKGRDGNPSAGGVGGNPGAERSGRGRSGDASGGQSRGDSAGGDGQRREAGEHGRSHSAGGDETDTEHSDGNHGQTVSARRHAAIEAWKASGQGGPPPWAGVGGGPGGNPNHPGQGQQTGRGHGRGKGRHGSKTGRGDEDKQAPGVENTDGRGATKGRARGQG